MDLALSDYRVRQRDYLLSIARAMVSRLNLRAVLRLILQGSVDLLQGHAGLIALRNNADEFTFWASYGLPPAMVEAFEPLVADVPDVADPAEFNIPDLETKLKEIAEETGLLLRQVVALPMSIEHEALYGFQPQRSQDRERAQRSRLLGVIYLFRPHSLQFSPDDRRMLSSFADYAAIAVNNARLYESAVTDRQRLDALLESSADGIMVLDPNLTVTRINQALVSLTGWRMEQTVGYPYTAVVNWARCESEQTLEEAVRQGWPHGKNQPLYVEGELARRTGSVVSVDIMYAPLLGRGGCLLNIIGIVRDITRFREADALKATFISVVSHELKTPVAIIRGYAETLQRPEARQNPGLVRELLGEIVEETDRLSNLVDDLLDASRLEAGGLSFTEVEAVDLEAIARDVVERYAAQAPGHELILDFASDFPTVDGDPARLEQVLDNLVSNAIKYSPRGGEVRVVGRFSPAEVTLAVQDRGVGIPLDEQRRIFERFYRVEGPETRGVSGTGLGLYLIRAIVEAHGGSIDVESRLGEGATFYVTLPRQTGLALWEDNAPDSIAL